MESGQVRFISRPDQFVINFDYLVRRLKRREG
jgi:hypothetical protein